MNIILKENKIKRKKYIKKKWSIKICPLCQNEFKAHYKNKIFCSRECLVEFNQSSYRRKPRSRPKKKCPHCNKEFSYWRDNQKLCPECQYEKEKNSSKRKASLRKSLNYWQIFNRDNFQCQYCGRTPTKDHIRLHLDHIKPQVDGGKTEIDNLVTACEKCNVIKATQPLRHEAEFKKRLQKKNNPINLQKSFDFLLGKN